MQHRVDNLLYCTDLSQNSHLGFDYAAYLAKLTGAKIHILHVLERLSDDAIFTIQTYVQDDTLRHDMMERRIERARRLLDEKQGAYWSTQTEADQKVRAQIASITVCESFPAEEILKLARQHDCDLIVMGTHERGLSHTFLGSVTKSVLRRSHVPTVIVPLVESH